MVMLRFPDDRAKFKKPKLIPMETPRPIMPKKDPSVTEKMGEYALTSSTNNLVDTTIPKIKDFFTPKVTPIAQAGTGMSPGMAQAVIGSGADKAALVAKQAGTPMSIALKGGAPALAEAGLAATGGTGLGSMATAAMASPLAPIIGGLALAKMFGFFSGGGRVGPLSAAQYKSAGGDVYKLSYGGGPLTKGE